MNITKVIVGYQETHSMPDYNNVRPSVTMEALVGPDETAADVLVKLRGLCRDDVHREIDRAREAIDLPALYSDETRFDLWLLQDLEWLFILPKGFNPKWDVDGPELPWVHPDAEVGYAPPVGHRYDKAIRMATRYIENSRKDVRLIDWSERIIDDCDTNASDMAWAIRSEFEDEGVWALAKIERRHPVRSGWMYCYISMPAHLAIPVRGMRLEILRFYPSRDKLHGAKKMLKDKHLREASDVEQLDKIIANFRAEYEDFCTTTQPGETPDADIDGGEIAF